MVKLTFTQKQLDNISTVLGIVSGIAGVLTANHIFDAQVGALITQTTGVVVSVLVGKIGVDTANQLRR